MVRFQSTCKKALFSILVMVFIYASCSSDTNPASQNEESPSDLDAFELNRLLGRGVNLGNALEAPNEGDWGVVLEESYFDSIRSAGFQTVRIPIRWSAHIIEQPVFQIESKFWKRVDWAVNEALSRNLCTIINVHHYEQIFSQPEAEESRFLEIWRQIAVHYRNYPPTLAFEILNEPHDQLTPEKWNDLLQRAVAVIRQSNAERNLIIGPANWNNLAGLERLQLPPDDQHIIVTFHYYDPFHFTHQGAEWVDGSSVWLGTRWTGTTQQVAAIQSDFDRVAAWSTKHKRPINLGEFGAYNKALLSDRVLWTQTVAREAERRNFSWCYWEFCAGFGIYNSQTRQWRKELLRALIPQNNGF